MPLKQRLVGTALGRFAMRSRSALEYFFTSREAIGTVANDQLAEFLVTRLCERSFADVGAHIGSIAAEVRKNCPGVRITCFEPIPEKASWLRKKFRGIEIVECALADYEGETTFNINVAATGYSSLADTVGQSRQITVPVHRLDRILTEVDVLKIDVEGAELGVLRGAERLTSRPIILFESAPREVLGYTKPDLWGWFNAHGYGVLLPNRVAHEAPPMSLEVFLDSHEYPRHTTNYFGVPLERTEAIRAKTRHILGL